MRTPILPVLLVLLTAAGCAATVAGPVRELPARARALLVRSPSVYEPAGAESPPTAETRALRAAFERAIPAEVRPMLRHDPTLDVAAAVFAETFSETDRRPAQALAQWVLYRSGSVGLGPRFDLGFSWGRGPGDLDRFGAAHAARLDVPVHHLAYGLARFTEGRVTSQAIVVATAPLEVKGFQKTYAPGGPLSLQIRPRDGSTDFVFYADRDDGTVDEERMERREDGTFFVSRAVPSRPGRYFVEVRATEPSALAADPTQPSVHTLLLVPIYVGVPEPVEPEDFIKNPASAPAEPGAWPAWVLSMLDAQRARWKKPPLLTDPRLTALAEARAAAVAGVLHEPRPERDLGATIKATGLYLRKYHWEVGRFDSVADHLYMGLLSPARRKRLVLSDGTMHAVGIAARPPDERGRITYSIAEYTLYP